MIVISLLHTSNIVNRRVCLQETESNFRAEKSTVRLGHRHCIDHRILYSSCYYTGFHA